VEGELLKQNAKALFSHKAWKKYYFIVSNYTRDALGANTSCGRI
jgi:hypothetical protein